MPGQPTIPARVHRRIRKLHESGHSKRAIADRVGHSLYTVNKAIDPEYAAREAERHRRRGPRQRSDDYQAYKAAHYQDNKQAIIARVLRNRHRTRHDQR